MTQDEIIDQSFSLNIQSDVKPPWFEWFVKRIGWSENNPAHDKELSKYWKLCHLNFKTCKGVKHSWCSLSICASLDDSGYKSSGSAAASSYANFGEKCEAKIGAIVPIRHVSGKHHVTLFAGWVDEKNMIIKGLGGNQSNKICIATYNLSGNNKGHDQLMNGFRFPVRKKES